MDSNYIDELALLKAFIDNKTLSYTEVQEKGIVPVLDKQDRRALFKNSIDKFKKWELIQPIPDSDPRAWTVIIDKATIEYNKLMKDIEQKQMVEKYSFQHLLEEVNLNSKKLKRIKLYQALAVTGFIVGTFNFLTGLSLPALFIAMKHVFHTITTHGH